MAFSRFWIHKLHAGCDWNLILFSQAIEAADRSKGLSAFWFPIRYLKRGILFFFVKVKTSWIKAPGWYSTKERRRWAKKVCPNKRERKDSSFPDFDKKEEKEIFGTICQFFEYAAALQKIPQTRWKITIPPKNASFFSEGLLCQSKVRRRRKLPPPLPTISP